MLIEYQKTKIQTFKEKVLYCELIVILPLKIVTI